MSASRPCRPPHRFPVIAVFLLLLFACAPRTFEPAIPVPAPPGTEERLLSRIEENALAFQTLEGVARVNVTARDRNWSANQIILAQKPDRLRAETLSPFGFGQPVLVMASDGDQLSVMVPGEGKFFRGGATSDNLQRFTRLPLQLVDLVHLLLYQVPLISHGQRDAALLPQGGFALTLVGEAGELQRLDFDRDLRLVAARYFRDEQPLLEITYGRFGEGAIPFPTLARLHIPPRELEASLDFSEVRTNGPIPPERFELTPPRGYEVLALPGE